MDSRRTNRPATTPNCFAAFEGDRTPQRADYNMVCRAIKSRWGIPQRTRDVMRAHALATIRDREASFPLRCSALRCLITIEGQSIEAVAAKFNLDADRLGLTPRRQRRRW